MNYILQFMRKNQFLGIYYVDAEITSKKNHFGRLYFDKIKFK